MFGLVAWCADLLIQGARGVRRGSRTCKGVTVPLAVAASPPWSCAIGTYTESMRNNDRPTSSADPTHTTADSSVSALAMRLGILRL